MTDEKLQTLASNNADEIVKERTERVEMVDTIENKEEKAKVINITNDDRIKRM